MTFWHHHRIMALLATRCTLCLKKNVTLCRCPYVHQILTIFKNFSHWHTLWTVGNKVVYDSPHLNCVATLPCEIQIFKNDYNQNKYIAKRSFETIFY